MTLWIDRTHKLQPGQPATHALVIGVSYYENLPSKGQLIRHGRPTFGLYQAHTPASGAFAFARWLRDSYHQPEAQLATVRLLLSPSRRERQADAEIDAASRVIDPARRDVVATEISEWAAACKENSANVAILYASGHGGQASKDDVFVLLEDFADPRNADILTYSIDVSRVFHGMKGPNTAESQFYFIDTCRSGNEELNQFEDPGQGVGLPSQRGGADTRCAAIYFSSSPDTPAYGEPGRGTIFSQALLDCLSGMAVDGAADEQGRWRVTTHSLAENLYHRVRELAKKSGATQISVLGGQVQPRMFHCLTAPPEVSVAIAVDPDAAIPYARAGLWDCDWSKALFRDEKLDPHPLVRTVPVGIYNLEVNVDPPTSPYSPRRVAWAVRPSNGRSQQTQVVCLA